MNWNELLTEIIISVVGILISGLGAYVTYLIQKHIKNEELKQIISELNNVVRNSVLETYQTYVQELKDKDIFDKEAQNLALNRALQLIKENIPEKVFEWLKSNFKDYESYLKSLIEAQIGALKNSGGR